VPDRVVTVEGVKGLSGIVYRPDTATLVGLAGRGEVVEMDLEGRVLRRSRSGNAALKDIVQAAQPGYALLFDARGQRVLRLRLFDLSVVEDDAISAAGSPPETAGGDFDGIARAGEALQWVLVNESHPASLAFTPDLQYKARKTYLPGTPSVSGVISDASGNLLLLSRESGLAMLSAGGGHRGAWRPINVEGAAGVALVPGRGLIVCTDTNPSELLIFRDLSSWQRIRDALDS
jgi:uncharacterized protein YjiK